MEDEKLPLAPPEEDKKEEENNPLLDVVENNLDVESDSVEIKVDIPFD